MAYKPSLSQVGANSNRINDLMEELEIDKDILINLPENEKVRYLIDLIPTAKDSHQKPATLPATFDAEYSLHSSLVILKPEIFPMQEELIVKLESLGYTHTAPKHIYPTTEQWMNLYGYMIKEHPDILQNYLIHRALGLKIMLLKNMDKQRLLHLNEQTGKAYENNPNTIRGSVSRRIMKELGFMGLRNYAASFDPCHFIADNDNVDYVFKCYNGIHTPSNVAENLANMETLCQIKK